MITCRRLWALGVLFPLLLPGVSRAAAVSVYSCNTTQTDGASASTDGRDAAGCTTANIRWRSVYPVADVYTKNEVNAAINTAVGTVAVDLDPYYTAAQVDAAINAAILTYMTNNPSTGTGTGGGALLPDLTLAEGGAIAGAMLGLWGFAWGIRAVKRVLDEG